jgi:hypothetical protein
MSGRSLAAAALTVTRGISDTGAYGLPGTATAMLPSRQTGLSLISGGPRSQTNPAKTRLPPRLAISRKRSEITCSGVSQVELYSCPTHLNR